jgi:hypothetical protein
MNEIATIEPESVTITVDKECKCRSGKLSTTKEKQANDFARRLAAEARGTVIASPHISEINAEMMQLFGGVGGFCKRWFGHIEIAELESPGSPKVLRAYRDMVELAKLSTEHRGSAPDVASLSDEELGREMMKLAGKVYKEKGKSNGKIEN